MGQKIVIKIRRAKLVESESILNIDPKFSEIIKSFSRNSLHFNERNQIWATSLITCECSARSRQLNMLICGPKQLIIIIYTLLQSTPKCMRVEKLQNYRLRDPFGFNVRYLWTHDHCTTLFASAYATPVIIMFSSALFVDGPCGTSRVQMLRIGGNSTQTPDFICIMRETFSCKRKN